MHCLNCGTIIPEGNYNCPNCGAPILQPEPETRRPDLHGSIPKL